MKKLVKRIPLMVIVTAFALLYIGCGSEHEYPSVNPTVNPSVNRNVLSERQIKVGEVAYTNENHIVLLSLEHPSTEQEAYDLNHTGSDCYTIIATSDLDNIELYIEENVSVSSVSIHDLQNDEQVIALKDGGETTFSFKQDKAYEFCVMHDGINDDLQPLFVRFVDTEKPSVGLDYDKGAIDTLKTTNKCIGCDLSYYDFSDNFSNLDGMNLTEANLTGSIMTGVSFILTTLNYTDLTGVDFANAVMIQTMVEHVDTIDMDKFWPQNLDRSSFAYTDLSGFNINDSVTRDVQHDINFSHAVLKDANFSNFTLIGCSLNDANLSGADLRGVSLIDTKVEHVSTIDMEMFKPLNIDQSSFAYTDLSGFNIHDSIVRDSQYGIDFSNAILRDANFSNYTLDKCSLNYADLTGADLRDVSLTDTSVEYVSTIDMGLFRPENLNGTSFAYTDLSGLSKHNFNLPDNEIDFTLAKYSGVSFAHAILRGANLHGAKIMGIDFTGADLSDANLSLVNLEGVRFSDANLSGADLFEALYYYIDGPVHTADFSRADLRGANMEYFLFISQSIRDPGILVNLTGADLSDAVMKGTGISYGCLSHIKCHRTRFEGSKIEDSVLYGAECQDAVYNDADFLHVNHVNAHMPGAVFQYDEDSDKYYIKGCPE